MAIILVVDDEVGIRELLSEILIDEGYDVRVAENATAARQVRNELRPDLVLLDVHMPVMDGTETIRAIRASGQPWANLPVIALTADAMTGDKERYLGMGMDGYMSKPIAERDLITEISRVRSLAPEQLAQNRQLKMVDAEDLAA